MTNQPNLSTSQPIPHLSDEARTRIRTQLVAHMEAHPIVATPSPYVRFLNTISPLTSSALRVPVLALVAILVVALGGTGISKSEVSRICAGLDEVVTAFRTRRLDHTPFPYVFLDATYLHVRCEAQMVVSKAVVVATGVTADGHREILGLDVGDSEDEVFWRAFLTSLRKRGLGGVKLVISDQHAGLVAASRRVLQGAAHQRCRVHFIRNLLAHVPKGQVDMVAAVFRTIFAQPDPAAMSATWDQVRDQLAQRFAKVGPLMDEAKAEVLRSTPSRGLTGARSGPPTP